MLKQGKQLIGRLGTRSAESAVDDEHRHAADPEPLSSRLVLANLVGKLVARKHRLDLVGVEADLDRQVDQRLMVRDRASRR